MKVWKHIIRGYISKNHHILCAVIKKKKNCTKKRTNCYPKMKNEKAR